MNENRYEIRLSGSGGQGIILASIVLAEAAGIYDGKYVCQSQSYGPEARGGTSKAEVVISNQVIDYPKAITLDLLLAMNQSSCDNYFSDLKHEGLLVVDATFVNEVPTSRVISIPFAKIAQKEVGKRLVANIVALGAIGVVSQVVSLKSLEEALINRVPKSTTEINRKALCAGIDEARKIDINALPQTVIHEDEEI